MTTIRHQFADQSFYLPTWEIKHLFLGTFNPSGGEAVKYYYGRGKNQTWPLLSTLFKTKFDPGHKDFIELIEEHGIACVDMIHELTIPFKDVSGVLGKGYKDTNII